MSIRKGSTVIAGNIGQNVDDNISLNSSNPVKNSAIAQRFEETLGKDNITNCLTEVPQNVNLNIYNGTLSALAGTKFYVPNGFEQDGITKKFDEITLDVDLQLNVGGSGWTNEPHLVVISSDLNESYGYAFQDVFSGDNAPTTTGQYALWYDTSSNIIRRTINAGATWSSTPFSLPICVAINTSGLCVNIREVFNSFGYIDKASFVLPGVKGLNPNGRNVNGSLKNQEIIITKVLVNDGISSGNPRISNDYLIFASDYLSTIWEEDLYLDYYPPVSATEWALVYDSNKNRYYYTNYGTAYAPTPNVNSHIKIYRDKTTGKIMNMNYEGQPFKSVDYNDTEFISHQSMPSGRYIDLTLGASGTSYIAPADGYMCFWKAAGAAEQYITLTNQSNGLATHEWVPMVGGGCCGYIPVSKGDSVYVTYTADGLTHLFRFIYANGAV